MSLTQCIIKLDKNGFFWDCICIVYAFTEKAKEYEPSLYLSDGVHPNIAGVNLIANKWIKLYKDKDYRDYFTKFNTNDKELVKNYIPNEKAESFLSENAPRLYCPDNPRIKGNVPFYDVFERISVLRIGQINNIEINNSGAEEITNFGE